MARVRHMLLSLLAILGLLTALGWTSAAAGCPLEPQAAMRMMHHSHHAPAAPMGRDVQACPACLAVLAVPAPVQVHAARPFAPLIAKLRPLFGIDPTLDPPPPRGA